eukprot:CAMPEP_0119261798 /NCGR_PEP_ID=MMETSP1329-20130426/1725_1 /TAXON_ID=114041 /ORGANISM="Genus nov. species nov., Strain RCC1024" /LENGTH=458 /DNA_ID=CAMNT_0007261379 /DNA_START=168 /DNA_END=1544 /DNA_ORIENTATION=+
MESAAPVDSVDVPVLGMAEEPREAPVETALVADIVEEAVPAAAEDEPAPVEAPAEDEPEDDDEPEEDEPEEEAALGEPAPAADDGTRKSTRKPVPSNNRYGYDTYEAERAEEQAAAAKRKKTMKPRREAVPGSKWDTYSKRLDGHIDKARRAAFFLEAYAMDTGGKKVKPTQEIQKAEETVATAKAEIRKILKEVAELYPDHRWGTEKAEVKGTVEDPDEEGEEGSIDVEEVACAVCGSYEADAENDIVMCDRTNCFRAFHVKCCEPQLTPEALGGPDDDWFCPQCVVIDNCVDKVNEYFDREYTAAGWADIFASDEEELRIAAEKKANAPKGFLDVELGSESDEDDEDFKSDDGEPDDEPKPRKKRERDAGDEEEESDESGCSGDSDEDEDSGAEVASDCSGDDPAVLGAEPPAIDVIDESNIVAHPRKRAKVDYAELNAAMSGEESDDGGAFPKVK